jgi:hypothetical protein
MNKLGRICIICREAKTVFTREHVFPIAIGGRFVVDLVCQDCNSLLGKKIDTPFTNHKEILLNRHHYGVKTGNRDVKNPFDGVRHFTEDGGEFVVRKTEENTYGAYHKPHYKIIQTENGPVGSLRVAKKWLTPELLVSFEKKFEAETGMKVVNTNTVIDDKASSERVVLKDSANPVIFGCLKIAYETAVACLPAYFDDPVAKIISRMLHSQVIESEHKSYFNPEPEQGALIEALIQNCDPIHKVHCFVVIMNMEGVGLVCIVKVFQIYYPLVLSRRTDYIDNRALVFLNNCVRKIFACTILKSSSAFRFGTSREISEEDALCSNPFTQQNGLTPLYDKNKNRILDHVDFLQFHAFGDQQPSDLASLMSIKFGFTKDSYYLLSTVTGSLYELLELTLIYTDQSKI